MKYQQCARRCQQLRAGSPFTRPVSCEARLGRIRFSITLAVECAIATCEHQQKGELLPSKFRGIDVCRPTFHS
jgi:hypothetical protein